MRIRIADEGLTVLTKLDAPSDEWTRGQLGHLNKAELRDLIRLLERAREGVSG